jgi:hypothetical protein
LTDPVIQWPVDEAPPSGLAYLGGSLWVACLRGQRLYRIPVGANGSLADPAQLLSASTGDCAPLLPHRMARCGSPPATAPSVTPPSDGPIISLPPISHDDAAMAGTATGITAAGILAWLTLVFQQN